MFASAPAGVVPNLLYSNNSAQQTSPRRQLFRRRGANSNNNLADATASERSPDGTANTSHESLLPPEANKAPVPSIGRTNSTMSQHVAEDLGMLMRDKYMALVSECSQTLLPGQPPSGVQNQKSQEMRLFVQRLMALLASPNSSSSRDSVGVPSLQYTVSATREVVKQFGYAAVESGRAVDIIAVLLRLLQPSSRTRVALRYLRDEQAGVIVNEHRRNHAQQSHGPAAEEVRKIDVTLRLLQSVLVASSDSASAGARLQTRLDSALMPSLRHLFDLLIVARPVSDTASQVLLLLLQRFDDPGESAHGVSSAFRWYETDPHLLHDAARAALSRIVALGFKDSDEEVASACGAPFVGASASTSRSVSPEMPVLVIDDEIEPGYQLSTLSEGDAELRGGNGLDVPDDSGREFGSFLYNVGTVPVAESDMVSDTGLVSDDDMLAQLDMFDKELDEALLA
ncbi:hypothetical protein GGI13_005889 [Coemansia sp. RSA 455]|nr:hypothetical protein GGI13_005889 [Coemansia sp. RSA 455]